MYRELAHLLLYSDLGEGAILTRLAGIFRDWEHGADRDELVGRIYAQIKRLLDLSTDCGFDENLWQCYLLSLIHIYLRWSAGRMYIRHWSRSRSNGPTAFHMACSMPCTHGRM